MQRDRQAAILLADLLTNNNFDQAIERLMGRLSTRSLEPWECPWSGPRPDHWPYHEGLDALQINVAVIGPPGVGKTSLVGKLIGRPHHEGLGMLTAASNFKSLPYHTHIPKLPIQLWDVP